MFNPTGDAESNQTLVISLVPVIQHQHSRSVLSTLIPSKCDQRLARLTLLNPMDPHMYHTDIPNSFIWSFWVENIQSFLQSQTRDERATVLKELKHHWCHLISWYFIHSTQRLIYGTVYSLLDKIWMDLHSSDRLFQLWSLSPCSYLQTHQCYSAHFTQLISD